MECDIEIKNKLSDKTILFLLCLYFILKPFYFWSSGLPQISDCVLVLLIIFHIINNKFIIRFFTQSKAFLFTGLGFVLYVLFINTVWSLILNGNLKFFITSAFYIYNFTASLMVLALYCEYYDVFFKYIYASVLASVFIQLAIYSISGGFDGTRALAFFNNPNQLGYHNVLMLAFLLMISRREKLSPLLFISGVIATLTLCFSSLSKAAIVAYSGMLFFFLFIKAITKAFNKKILIYLLIVLLILSMMNYFYRGVITSNRLYISVMHRILRIGLDKDDNLIGRGYDRLVRYPRYLIFGAGEGENMRFGYDMEFHSTLGNILMSYGIIGLLLYLNSILFAFKNNGWKDAYIVFFILLYGLTHNGIRNTLLWMLVALISVDDTEANMSIYNSAENGGKLSGRSSKYREDSAYSTEYDYGNG